MPPAGIIGARARLFHRLIVFWKGATPGRDLAAENSLRAHTERKVLEGAPADIFQRMAAQFPATPPQTVTVVGLSLTTFPGNQEVAQRTHVTLQYQFDHTWLLAHAAWRDTPSGERIIESMTVQPLPASLADINRVTLSGKSAAHYLMLGLAVGFPLICLTALALCLATPMTRRRKLLWAVGVVLGVCPVAMNWTDGSVFFTPLSVQLLAVGWHQASGYAPLFISVAPPLFALLFLWKRRRGGFAPPPPATPQDG